MVASSLRFRNKKHSICWVIIHNHFFIQCKVLPTHKVIVNHFIFIVVTNEMLIIINARESSIETGVIYYNEQMRE